MTARHIKAITFDLDNTLWDVKPVLRRAEQAQNLWLQRHRPDVFDHFDSEALLQFRLHCWQAHPELAHQISKLRTRSLYELQLHCGYSAPAARAGAAAAFAAFLAARQQVTLFPQAPEVLAQLAQHYALGALTNGNADVFKLAIGEHFDFAFTAEQLNAGKPLPAMFHAGMKRADAACHEVIHVGDDPGHDVQGAQQLGIHTVWMNSTDHNWPGGPPADEEISRLVQLPVAIARIEARIEARGRDNG